MKFWVKGATPNKHGFVGVWFDKKRRKFRAAIDRRGSGRKRKYFGSFLTAVEAAQAYDAGAIEEYGDEAFLNFPLNGQKQIVKGRRTENCRHGHDLSVTGYFSPDGQFGCRACNLAAVKKYNETKNMPRLSSECIDLASEEHAA